MRHAANDSERVAWVIEDDRAMRQAIERVLRARDIPVLAFASAEEAIARAGAERAACLVVDLGLPGMSGFAFYEALTARPPVVFISATDDDAARAHAERLGAAAFMHKPFSGRALAELVARFLGSHAAG